MDLLGVDKDGALVPVVVELKRGGSNDSPLGILLEALAYGVAIRELWNDIAREWKDKAIRMTPESCLATEIRRGVCG